MNYVKVRAGLDMNMFQLVVKVSGNMCQAGLALAEPLVMITCRFRHFGWSGSQDLVLAPASDPPWPNGAT